MDFRTSFLLSSSYILPQGYRIENYFFRQLHMSPLRVMEESEANAVYIPVAPGATVKRYDAYKELYASKCSILKKQPRIMGNPHFIDRLLLHPVILTT